MRYQDKVTIVTGAAQGIGAGCARIFAQAGAHVIVADRKEAEGQAVAAEINGTFVKTDVTQSGDIQRLIDTAIEKYGRLDCLINNAGWHPPYHTIDEFSLDDLRAVLEVNVVSVFAASKFALPHLRKTQGNIINIASLVGTMAQPHATTYVASKGAVVAFTKALAIDEACHGVRVNSVSPGNIWTPLWKEGADASPDPAQTIADGEAVQWLGRMGTPEEAGRLCLFIAADATFTTGVDHLLTGGAEIGYGHKPVI